MLDHKYTQWTVELGALEGCDKVLAEKLIKEGFSVRVLPVLYKVATQMGFYPESDSKVFSWTDDDLKYVLGVAPKPNHSLKNVPFFKIGSLGKKVDEEDVAVNESEESKCLYWNVALIACKPTWWTGARLLWIAKLKNSPQACHIARLPKEIVKVISDFVSDSSQED